MADTPPIKITERLVNLDTYKKWAVYVLVTIGAVLLLVGGVSLWRFIFPKPTQQVNKPTAFAVGKVEKGAITQTSTQISLDDKSWEVGLGGGGVTYDNKSGIIIGGWVKKKF